MTKYREKPVVIDAIHWNGKNVKEVMDSMGWRRNAVQHRGVVIHTLEGNHQALPGGFIIKGVAGEFYPCKPENFYATYDAVQVTQ